ncbi:DNA ligase 3-like isoform X2 [Homarus americanus]|nr:DNA ligase 3-like isoform X2 [Homarus americanus]
MLKVAATVSRRSEKAVKQFIHSVTLTRRAFEPVCGTALHIFTGRNIFVLNRQYLSSDSSLTSCHRVRELVSSPPFLKYSQEVDIMSSFPFCAEYDKRGAAKCKKCKDKCEKGALRIGKIVPNPFSESAGEMKQWHHVDCIFEIFKRARATTKKIEDPVEDIEGWENLEDDDQKKIRALVDDLLENANTPKKTTSKKTTPKKQTPQKKTAQKTGKLGPSTPSGGESSSAPPPPRTDPGMDRTHKDNAFREFRRICANIAEESSYLGKTEILSNFLKNGTSKTGFQGDLRLWVKLLLPGVVKRVYNLQSKQLIKLFSQIFNTNLEEMMEDLEQGDVAETVSTFFERSAMLPPAKKSILSIQEVDEMLQDLTGKTREEEQSLHLKKITQKCTSNDLKMVVRLIKGDLRINAGAKHILEAIHPDAYEAFQTTRNIDNVIDQILEAGSSGVNLKMKAQVMTPVLPMLAEACKSVDYAFKKCPSGAMFAEIKYDGERVQVHKKGNKFMYFSRSLKPVMPHKVSHFKNFIPEAFPESKDLILDAEVLMINTKTGIPLPFGTLGVHKKAEFQDANVCLFVFDCIHYNGEDLMNKALSERRKVLEENMTPIQNRILFSEMKLIRKKEDLRDMINRALREGLEGLVLKDINGIYEPGKRHWLKIKKDYLNDGAMADSADLVVLGAWYGTGKKGGMMSVFLMGCFDPRINKWCTVTKVHTGFDDTALERLQNDLNMVKISQDASRVPSWLKCNKPMTPDFVAADPKKSPVWEVTGAEFTRHQIHTADGISIRFPRVTKERGDKTWEEATDLKELQVLYKNSRENLDYEALTAQTTSKTDDDDDDDDDDSSKKSGGSGSSTPVRQPPTSRGSPTPARQPPISESPSATASSSKISEEKSKVKRTGRELFKHEKVKKEEKMEEENKTDSRKRIMKPEEKKHEEEEEPVRKKKCKYGAECHNDNVAHRYLYDHPAPPSSKPPTINPLPDIFTGVQVTLPDSLDEVDVLRRYIIAYGGEVLPKFRSHEATHLIIDQGVSSTLPQCTTETRRVTTTWLWDSIKLQSRQPTRLYCI